MAEYPARCKYFAHKLIRLMVRSCAAQDIGVDGFALVTVIVHTEDAKRYSGPVTFWNEQLMPLLGFNSWGQLDRARDKAIAAGWLHYESGGKRKVGRYWATVPLALDEIPDGAVDCDYHAIIAKNDDNSVEEPRDKRDRTGGEPGENRGRSGEHSILVRVPSPNPKDTHSLTSEESTFHVNAGTVRQPQPLRLPQHADTQRNREQLEAWQTVRQATHGQRTNAVAWDAEAMLHSSWSESAWFDALQFSTSKAAKSLLDPASDFQKRRAVGASSSTPRVGAGQRYQGD